MSAAPHSRSDFEVAIACALPREHDAVSLLIDQFWDNGSDRYGRAVGDENIYTTGRMGGTNVVLVLLPNMGKTSAAVTAANLRSSYHGLRLVLLTGICGGAPKTTEDEEVLLGDVIISKSVVQHDLGRRYADGFVTKDTVEDTLGRPSRKIRNLIAYLETVRVREQLEERVSLFLREIQKKPTGRRGRPKYEYPGPDRDRLFQASYAHKHYISVACVCADYRESTDPVCEASRSLACDKLGCDDAYIVRRERIEQNRRLVGEGRRQEAQAPWIFVGRVGSGDMVVKSAKDRDTLAERHTILGFEMEGAGFWDEFPCIVIKGVCDYADSHKNKEWQDFAAATAAATAKALLEQCVVTDKPRSVQVRTELEGQSISVGRQLGKGPDAMATDSTVPTTWTTEYQAPVATTQNAPLGLPAENTHPNPNSVDEKHQDTLMTIQALADALYKQRKFKEAEQMYRRALDITEKALGKEHPDTLRTVHNLALALYGQGKWQVAERINQRALKSRERVLGKEHQDSLLSVCNIALALYKQGKYQEAEQMNRRALDIRERVLGEEHKDTLQCVHDLALILCGKRNYQHAEWMNRRALDGREIVLGEEHQGTLETIHNLAFVLFRQGKYYEAEQICRRALDGRDRILGETHEDTLQTVNQFALILYRQRRYQEAEPLYRRALNGRDSVLGKEHYDTLETIHGLARTLQQRGVYRQAEQLYRRALDSEERLLGKEHEDTLRTTHALELVLNQQGKR